MELINKRYIPEYLRSLIVENDDEMAKFRLECEKDKIPIVHKEVGQLIKLLITMTKTKRILELGTAVGYSSIIMSKIIDSEDGLITTIERRKLFIDQAKSNIDLYNPPTPIEIMEGDALLVLDSIEGEYDMIFLDAAKSKYMDFLPRCMNLLKPGGLIVSDNVLYKGMIATDDLVVRRQRTIVRKMRLYLKYISEHEALETSILPMGDGVSISFKKETKSR